VLVHDAAGAIRVIHNQCAHRGALVVATGRGNAAEFTCCYHGWTYHLDGRIKRVPLQHGIRAISMMASLMTEALTRFVQPARVHRHIYKSDHTLGPHPEEAALFARPSRRMAADTISLVLSFVTRRKDAALIGTRLNGSI